MRLSSIVKLKKNKFQFQAIQSWHCDKNSHGGGVATYLRDTLNFEHRTDLKTDNLEMICIELKPKCTKPFILLAWYRPSNYKTETLTEVNT